MSSESIPEHIQRPHLRPVQPVPVKDKSGRQLVALRDPAMLSKQTMIVPMPVMQILQLFRGDLSLEDIARQIKSEAGQLVQLAEGLDKVGLLWGPTCERLESEAKARLESEGAFPIRSTMSLGEDEAACHDALNGYFDQTEDPELDGKIVGIVAPHLDYERGWPNYAAAYFNLRETDAPDRIVILGTNHNGIGDGVVLTEFGFTSPLGRCPADDDVVSRIVDRLGRPIVVDQLDHMGEHSIELQLPWIQHCWGNVPIIAALLPDPLTPMIADDGERAAREPFVEALGEVLEEVGGRTFYIASCDLSHCGPQFGEPRPVDEQRRFDIEKIDRENMAKFLTGDAEEFLSAMRWNKNPTRWCSVGSLAATLELLEPETVELIDYRQTYDERGMALVSSAAMALM
jgi:AmmeMemoRadiSam system protein B